MLPNALICNFPCIGQDKSFDSDSITEYHKPREPVLLNVYDMYKINGYTCNLGFGVFHSGVEVYGVEYGYGGHPHNYTGIFDMEPKNEMALAEFFNMRGQLKFKQTVLIGYTTFTCEEVENVKNRLGHKFRGDRYHLINNNCNHFSAAFTKILCRKTIPAWVNRLAYVGSFIPFLNKILPSEFIGLSTQHMEK